MFRSSGFFIRFPYTLHPPGLEAERGPLSLEGPSWAARDPENLRVWGCQAPSVRVTGSSPVVSSTQSFPCVPETRAPGLLLGPDASATRRPPFSRVQLALRPPILTGEGRESRGPGARALRSAGEDDPSSDSQLALLSREPLRQRVASSASQKRRHFKSERGRFSPEKTHPPAWSGGPHAAPSSTLRPGHRGSASRARRGADSRAPGPFLTASRPLSWAPLAKRASVLDLRSISSMMPWMWPPEIPWKSMAGGRKGHELSSARHPTISIYTRPELSAHPSEGAEGTAEGCALEEHRDARGPRAGGKGKKKEADGVEIGLLGKEKKKKGAGGAPAASRRRCAENKQTRRRGEQRKKGDLTALRDRITNGKQLRRGRTTKSEEERN